ncbi:hypothetical protein COL26b_013505 [Colletotrichum chrysophilum]|uniref:uncharacterized protein n=1 Tax=Colletotrichum chrysophilum TaxID=1836956 RepID=UPI002300ACA6|nr:uncharacterized protein COL26b_013505 [Colletotrichum chrysophilum]KAJ0362058.1 hypothetical protein COL26b_013505 [Colletotrichum chrysophilum]
MEALPVETIVEIMRQCDSIGDLLALASTCERFQSTFDKFSPSILQHLRAPGIPDFDDALVVVRATAIVKDYYAKGVLPPQPFPFDQLAHGKSPATLIEYQKVANLIEFLKLIEAEFAHIWRKYLPYIKDDLDDLRRSWEGVFNDSMLKALLMNAALAGEMAEPFWNAGQKLSHPSDTGAKILQSIEDPGSRHLGGSWQRDESGMTWVTRDHYAEVKDWLNDKDIQYLETYTAYRNDRFTGLSKDLCNTTFGKLPKHFRLENKSADCFLPRVFQTTLRDLQDYAFFEHPVDQENLPYFQSRFNSDSPIKQMVVAILHLGPFLPGKLTRLSPEAHAGRKTVDFVPFGCFNVHTYAFDAVEGDYWEPEFFWGQVGGISLLKAHKPHGVDSGGKFADLTDILSFHRGDLDYIFEKNDEKYNCGYDRRCQAEADWDTRWNRIRCDGDMDW